MGTIGIGHLLTAPFPSCGGESRVRRMIAHEMGMTDFRIWTVSRHFVCLLRWGALLATKPPQGGGVRNPVRLHGDLVSSGDGMRWTGETFVQGETRNSGRTQTSGIRNENRPVDGAIGRTASCGWRKFRPAASLI
jgi:hypothetical protein